MPVHPHHRAEGLKPEWMREPAQELRSPVFEHDGFDDDPPEFRHAPGEPRGYVTGVEGEIGTARTLRHAIRAALALHRAPQGRALSRSLQREVDQPRNECPRREPGQRPEFGIHRNGGESRKGVDLIHQKLALRGQE
jgi:hypothetical protein